MKRQIRSAKEVEKPLDQHDDFDERWDERFGEPSTEVFTVDEFKKWFEEVMDFE